MIRNGLTYSFIIILTCISSSLNCFGFDSPFGVSADITMANQTTAVLTVQYTIPPRHHLYADMMSIDVPDGAALTPKNVPAPQKKFDPLSEEEQEMYEHNFSAQYYLINAGTGPVPITVNIQGCDESLCYMPESLPFTLNAAAAPAVSETALQEPVPPGITASNDWKSLLRGFSVAGSTAGYLPRDSFLTFLDSVESGTAATDQSYINSFNQRSLLLSIILFILYGFLLNLTPCVLPMIPINLGIIGAGVQAGSRRRGFGLGAMFGLGIALTYGLLGVVFVLTGAQFGTLNSTWWFNFGIAIVFVLLSLAMFDVFSIDFSRFQHSAAKRWTNKGTLLAALILGSITALLSGACVAPIVIQVLIISADMYNRGITGGLFLPFLLGVGMALPWPIAGAGFSLLPKPGRWMAYIKYGFGALILLFAGYYVILGLAVLGLVSPFWESPAADHMPHQTSLPVALHIAARENKPVFIDFWATWCKNCTAMDKTTFQDSDVRKRLEKYVILRYQAEKPNQQPVKDVLDYFAVKGLPTYVILQPGTQPDTL